MNAKLRRANPSDIRHGNEQKISSSSKLKSFFSRRTISTVSSKFQEGCRIFCRAIGLTVLVSFSGFEEKTMIAIEKNQPAALVRALVHVVPVGVALWEIILNWNTYYVGSYLLKQVKLHFIIWFSCGFSFSLVYYQTAAKIHEIMIQASLAAIVFSYIRHQMVLGNGIPFGALFSGLQLNQIAYLWSMEFWGSMSSNYLSIWNRTKMLVLISFCFILAAVAGPSSAILLIPRMGNWPAGSTHIWVNGTFDDTWPNRMNGFSVPQHCAVVEAGSVSTECPSSEWDSIQTWLSLFENAIPIGLRNQSTLLRTRSIFPAAIQLTGKTSARELKSGEAGFIDEGSDPNQALNEAFVTSTTQQAAIADALTDTSSIWGLALTSLQVRENHGVSYSDDQKTMHTIANDYYQPYSAALCVLDTIQGQNDQKPITFPVFPGYENFHDSLLLSNINTSISGYPAVKMLSLPRASLLKLPGRESDNRVKWVQLPKDSITGISIGLVVLLPKNPSDSFKPNTTIKEQDTDTDTVVCSISAGWGTSSINMTYTYEGNSATSSLSKIDVSTQFTFPSKQIEIDIEWAKYLNPYVPSANTTVIDLLMKYGATNGSKAEKPEYLAQEVLSSKFTNGLARSGFTSQLQGNMTLSSHEKSFVEPNLNGYNYHYEKELDVSGWLSGKKDFFTVNPEESKNWVKLRVDSTIQGYAYNIEGPAPKIATAFLLLYCCLALGHCFYSGILGISSSCWDSISEVTALAINSPSTAMLKNTCAGITEIRIFRIPVRILTKSDEEGEGEHLELIFGNVEHEDTQRRAIKPNRKYGTMPAGTATKEAFLAEKPLKLD